MGEDLLATADAALTRLRGRTMDAVRLHCPSPADAHLFALIVSKLSPLLGNIFESEVVRTLNAEARPAGWSWMRQDPGFPDVVLAKGAERSGPGIEIKAWYVHSTEITGRFKESVRLLQKRDVHVAVIAWTMSDVLHGQPYVLDVGLFPALDIAVQRDVKYHKPPLYLCREPEDTTMRTANLQQSNVNGFRLQGSPAEQAAAGVFARSKLSDFSSPAHTPVNQSASAELMSRFPYRLDTNFAKLDRIEYGPLERFKERMLATRLQERLSVLEWTSVLRQLASDSPSAAALSKVEGLLR